jgi:hypothetical protein
MQDMDFYQQGIEKLVPQYYKCLSSWRELHGKVVG